MKITDKIKNLIRSAVNTATTQNKIDNPGYYTQVATRGFVCRNQDVTIEACAKILADSISAVDFGFYKNNDKILKNPYYTCLEVKPNDWQNSSEFWYKMERDRVIHGNAYAYIKHNKAGNLEQLIPLNPLYMTVYINNTQEVTEAKIIYEYRDPERGDVFTMLPDEILHLKANTVNGIMGVPTASVLSSIIQENDLAASYLQEIYNNGYSGVMVLSYVSDLSVEKRKALLNQVKEVLQSQGSRMLAIPNNIEAKILGPTNIDPSYLNLRDRGVRKIAGYLGIPLFLLNEENNAGTSAMTSAQASAFYSTTLKPIIKQYCNELTAKLLTTKQINDGYRFDDDDLFGFGYLSANERTDNFAKLVAAGILTVNEIRGEMGYPKYIDNINSGDLLYRNGAFTVADNGDSIGSKEEKIAPDHTAKAQN
jgi:HK97 family phage portal protein